MATYKVYASAVIDITIEVEADSMEEAMEIAEDVSMETYSNETVGVEYGDGSILGVTVDSMDDIDWFKAFAEEV